MSERIKGQLLRSKPYKISGNRYDSGLKVSVSELSGLKVGDLVFQEKLENGIIILIPENLYKENE